MDIKMKTEWLNAKMSLAQEVPELFIAHVVAVQGDMTVK